MDSNRERLLETIYTRGRHLAATRRRRQLGVLAIGGVLAVTAVIGAVAARPDRTRLATTAPVESTSPTSPTTTSTPASNSDTTTVVSPSTDTPPPSTTAPSPPPTSTDEPTTTLVCHNSTDPACGPFEYAWTTPNQPATISITASPAQPHVGEQVMFTITIDDPDGQPISACSMFDPGPGSAGQGTCGDGVPPGYGPWDPPPPRHSVFTYNATYTTSGDRHISYTTEEGGACDDSGCPPRAHGDLDLTVTP